MKIYLVGGAVRDELLGLPIKEKDWVVVGATPEMLIEQQYQPVGKSFPVFLHPQTKEEYALARTERKVSGGYHGFIFHADPSVTLEEDLQRRDLTINAIAKTEDGTLIDPYGGINDIKNRVLRHVSAAFSEDPVRVLRIARFAGRFNHLGFTVAPETLNLLQMMSAGEELDYLVPERVWKEMQTALGEETPSVFFEVLEQVNALKKLLPELPPLNKVSLLLEEIANKTNKASLRFSIICALMPKPVFTLLVKRLKIPNEYSELAQLVIDCQMSVDEIKSIMPAKMLDLFDKTSAYRKKERFKEFLFLLDTLKVLHVKKETFLKVLEIANSINSSEVIERLSDKSGESIKQAIYQARLKKIINQFN